MSNTWFRLRRGFFLSFFPSDTPHYENVPFELPNSWVWCRLEDIAYVASGSTPDKTCFVENGVPYIKMYNLRNQKIDFAYHPQYITEEVHNGKLQRSRTEVGDLIMNIVGPPLGKLAIIPTTLPQANFNQAAVLIRPYKFKEVLVSYLKVYLEEMSEINSIATRGSAGQVNISLTQSQNMRIPIPPLNEVRRIIEEVSKYDILIDSLKQNITDIQNLIAYTKSKILDLAIHGKLVPQDPNDEPAIELLKRINPDFTPCDNRHYTQLPNGWCTTTLKDLCENINGLWKGKKEPFVHVGVIRNANFTKDFKLDYSNIEYIDVEQRTFTKRHLMNGDLIVEKSGGSDNNPVGRTILYEGEGGVFSFSNFTMVLRIKYSNTILSKFLYYYILAIYQTGAMRLMQTQTTGLHNLILDKFLLMPIYLPPPSEQKRIIDKIEMIFATLDMIMESL